MKSSKTFLLAIYFLTITSMGNAKSQGNKYQNHDALSLACSIQVDRFAIIMKEEAERKELACDKNQKQEFNGAIYGYDEEECNEQKVEFERSKAYKHIMPIFYNMAKSSGNLVASETLMYDCQRGILFVEGTHTDYDKDPLTIERTAYEAKLYYDTKQERVNVVYGNTILDFNLAVTNTEDYGKKIFFVEGLPAGLMGTKNTMEVNGKIQYLAGDDFWLSFNFLLYPANFQLSNEVITEEDLYGNQIVDYSQLLSQLSSK